MKYSFWIKNGRVIDPARGVDRKEDLFLAGGKIAPAPAVPEREDYEEIIDAKGMLVLPGLIDFHTHLGYRNTDLGLNPDLHMLPNGVVAAVDAGSGGSATFEGLYQNVFARAAIRIRSLLNVAATGLPTEIYNENTDPALFDAAGVERLLLRHPKELFGFKIRLGRAVQNEESLAHLKGALRNIAPYKLPLVTHVCDVPCGVGKVAETLRPGDVLCHCFAAKGGCTILDEKGRVCSEVREARARGVLFDAANARFHHSLEVMRRAIGEGFYPDFLGTDVVRFSIYRPSLYSILRIMSEYLAVGMPLYEIIRAVSATPAKKAFPEMGTLAPGAAANVFICELKERKVTFRDFFGNEVLGERLFVPQMTISGGEIAYRQIEFTF